MAGAQISLDRAYLTAIWLETLFYGMNVCLFSSYIYIVGFRRVRQVSRVIFAIAVFMFCFSTIHVSLGFSRLVWGFVVHRDDPGGPSAYFSDVSQPANVAKVTIHTVNSILGDSIVVWRCWHVWARDIRICILPVLLIIGSAVCGFGQAYIFATAKTTHSAFATTLARWNGSLFSLSFATNVVVTILIGVRIWFIMRDSGGNVMAGAPFRYYKVFLLIIESAAIYSAAVLIEIVLYFSNSNAFYIVYDPIAQLTGIVPTMIIIISTLGLTIEDMDADSSQGTLTTFKVNSTMRFGTRGTVTDMGTGTETITTTRRTARRSDAYTEDPDPSFFEMDGEGASWKGAHTLSPIRSGPEVGIRVDVRSGDRDVAVPRGAWSLVDCGLLPPALVQQPPARQLLCAGLDVDALSSARPGGDLLIKPIFHEKNKLAESSSTDYYTVLAISSSATFAEVKAAYHRALLASHPDKHLPGTQDHVIDIGLLKEAYNTLYSPELRKAYDVAREAHTKRAGPRPAQVISLEEFDDESGTKWTHSCRCGGSYVVTEEMLDSGQHLVACASCSEVIWVGYELIEDAEGTEVR